MTEVNTNYFPGQQSDERVLYYTKPHPAVKYFAFLRVIVLGILAGGAFFIISLNLAVIASPLRLMGIVLSVLFILIGLFWIQKTHDNTEIYITDRRIVKFSPLSPFHRTMRTLFWDEAVKSKTYRKNPLLEKILGIGSVEIHARSQDKDNVDIDYLTYHEDLSNYIDKILYTYKTNPGDLKTFKPFVAKPRGKRD